MSLEYNELILLDALAYYREFSDFLSMKLGEKQFQIDYVRVYDKGAFTPTEVTSLPLEAYIEGADASLVNKDGKTEITVRNAGALEYGVMGIIKGNKIQTGETYTLSFDVSSDTEREMIVTAEDSVYTRFLDEKLKITPEKTYYSFDVTFTDNMAGNLADLKFQLGNISNASLLSEHTVILSNISWQKKQ